MNGPCGQSLSLSGTNDWEGDMVADEHVSRDPTTQEAAGHEAVDHASPASQKSTKESADQESEAPGSLGLDVQDVTLPGNFPEIQVWYRGKEYPFFSQSSDGFFGDVSVLDDNIGTILSELRGMLEAEIGERNELVFQVDKLGLEFCEASS